MCFTICLCSSDQGKFHGVFPNVVPRLSERLGVFEVVSTDLNGWIGYIVCYHLNPGTFYHWEANEVRRYPTFSAHNIAKWLPSITIRVIVIYLVTFLVY